MKNYKEEVFNQLHNKNTNLTPQQVWLKGKFPEIQVIISVIINLRCSTLVMRKIQNPMSVSFSTELQQTGDIINT